MRPPTSPLSRPSHGAAEEARCQCGTGMGRTWTSKPESPSPSLFGLLALLPSFASHGMSDETLGLGLGRIRGIISPPLWEPRGGLVLSPQAPAFGQLPHVGKIISCGAL